MNHTSTNPYVGLRPFNDQESLLFFGRNEQTLELLSKLHKHHFVAVVGSSGCGKSSLLRAGLIPSLKAGYLVNDSDQWLIAIMKPGHSPMYNLAKSILEQLYQSTDEDAINQLMQTIEEEGSDALLRLLSGVDKKNHVNFFLLVDQFEELFRFSAENKTRDQQDKAIDFVNIILELAEQKVVPIYVVLTMRSDFIGDCSEFHGLPEAMNRSLYLVPKLNRQQLKLVIEAPAKLFNRKVDSALTSKLLNALGKVKDELPLLQHALMRIWDYEETEGKDGALNIDDYKAIGGLENALSFHADEALKTLNKEEFQIARQLFRALTTVDEHGRKTRRPIRFKELQQLVGAAPEQLDKIIDAFIKDQRSFLMIESSPELDERIIDISHESLIRQWGRLGRWVEEEGEAAANYYKLTQDTLLHKEGKKDLLTGTELELASEWRKTFNPSRAWAERYNQQYESSIAYLESSEVADKKEKRKKKLTKIGTRTVLGLLVAVALAWLSKELVASRKAAEAALHKHEELMAEVQKLFDEANIDQTQNTGQEDQFYLEGYKDVLGFIESQQAFYENDKKPDEMGVFVYDPEEDDLQDDAEEFWLRAFDSLRLRESRIDERIWSLAQNSTNENKVKAYRDYLKTTETFRYYEPHYIPEAEAELENLESVDPNWISATTKNTVNAYVGYLKKLQDTYGVQAEVPADKAKYIDSAYARIADSRQGWLFAGRLNSSRSRMDDKDRIFSTVYRSELETVSANAIPEPNDILRMIDSRSRNVYNDFTGSSVVNKKSVIIRQNDYAMAKAVEVLLGGAVFIQIHY